LAETSNGLYQAELIHQRTPWKTREALERRRWNGRRGSTTSGCSNPQAYRPIPEIDHWLRRRVRMCYWKQWRYVRTKVRNLLALGTFKRQAVLTALSSKSYWHLSRTLATQSGMTNEWLQRQGLISVRDLWMKAHGYA
jgi:RNA-directed DNA polymerase